MKKALLVVDPQYDFINGALPVPGAVSAMDDLAAFISDNAKEYALVIVTADWHPYDHMSFAENGGKWPSHCLGYSVGASIYDPILRAIIASKVPMTVLTKGLDPDKEEYSIFQNEECAEYIEALVADFNIERIDVCGLAGDVCVLNTLQDAVKAFGAKNVTVLEQFSPSIDGGAKLKAKVASLLGKSAK